MTLLLPTPNQIKAQVDAVLEREPEARCVAIRSPEAGSWPEIVSVRDRAFRLKWCDSPLSVRQCLTEAEASEENGVVLLTGLDDRALGSDVVARLSRGRVFQLDSWDMVRRLFHARGIDSRLANHTWVANLLLNNAPPAGYPPVSGGLLDLETAWRFVLETSFGLSGGRPDAVTLLQWSMARDAVERFGEFADAVRSDIREWIAQSAGPVGDLTMACVASGHGLDAFPVGLICGVVFAQVQGPQLDLAAAAVRLERFTGDRGIRPDEGRRWAEAAAWVARNTDDAERVRPFLERADGLLQELHVVAYAGLNEVLPSGFEARLSAFGTALSTFLGARSDQSLRRMESCASSVLGHDRGHWSTARNERVQMALRLARWLTVPSDLPAAFGPLAQSYARDAAFVDWARLKLLGGDELAALSSAYGALTDAVRERREALNRKFGEALRIWNAEGSAAGMCLPVERILEAIVGPLARQTPVLLLVVDGLSFPIFEELCGDLQRHGWTEFISDEANFALVGIAALPTVTEISRASLLTGQLAAGGASAEKSAFAAHPALVSASKAASKPIAFHKGELADGLGLSHAVRDAVGNRDRRVVAVVYNAVDDHLSGSDQLHLHWPLDELRLLQPLLHEARAAGRALVITADHGHVIDEKTSQGIGSNGDRWRSYSWPVQEGEVLLEGGRVKTAAGANRVVCAWSEHLRYSNKKNGYHGGASPQEVVVPLSVFLPPGVALGGWKPAPPVQPEWWEDRIMEDRPQPVVPLPAIKQRKSRLEGQGELFEGAEPEAHSDWIGGLLGTRTYQQQRQLAARVAPRDEDMRRLLEALDGRGGKLSKAALAQRLGMPLVRVSGFVNAARRVLNVDQSAVLSLDETSGIVELNCELLGVQFQLRLR